MSKILKHRCKGEAVKRASNASLMRRYGSGVAAVTNPSEVADGGEDLRR
jgi:hypothetical protein